MCGGQYGRMLPSKDGLHQTESRSSTSAALLPLVVRPLWMGLAPFPQPVSILQATSVAPQAPLVVAVFFYSIWLSGRPAHRRAQFRELFHEMGMRATDGVRIANDRLALDLDRGQEQPEHDADDVGRLDNRRTK